MRVLTTLPVYNEEHHVAAVMAAIAAHASDILVVNDGSSDGTAAELAKFPHVAVLTHEKNQGYGAAINSAFQYALKNAYDVLVTIDCDGQHEPQRIPELVAALTEDVDIVSGSRYLRSFSGDSIPPEDRRFINATITRMLNAAFNWNMTDSFCGFKAYRVSSLAKLETTVTGYAVPLQFWVQVAALGLRWIEYPVPLIYLEEKRSFGGSLDDSKIRLAHYRDVFASELSRHPELRDKVTARLQELDVLPATGAAPTGAVH